MIVDNEQDLGKAVDDHEETIDLEGKLASRIKRIWLLDRFLWCLCLACLAVAIAALVAMPSTCGMSAAVSLVAGTPAALFMGTPAAATAVLTAAAGSGIATLKELRHGYRLECISSERAVLHRKHGKAQRGGRQTRPYDDSNH